MLYVHNRISIGEWGTSINVNVAGPQTTVSMAPGAWTVRKVEQLRNDLASGDEKVNQYRVGNKMASGSTSFRGLGGCNPDGGDYDCDFFTCPSGSVTQSTFLVSAASGTVEGIYLGTRQVNWQVDM